MENMLKDLLFRLWLPFQKLPEVNEAMVGKDVSNIEMGQAVVINPGEARRA